LAKTSAADLDATAILSRLAVPDHPNVFVLGAFASRLTFNAQQARAFNLIWALGETGRIVEGQRLVVVGAGVAGLTAAAAACSRGCNVTLFERSSDVLALQRGNYVRHIHPNSLDWPASSSAERSTHWPFLNWTSGTVDNVVQRIEADWLRFADHITIRTRHEVLGPVIDVDGRQVLRVVSLDASNRDPQPVDYDYIVLAVGFGLERTLERVPGRSYWLNDSLHQEVPFAPAEARKILVTGCGDGGLIDCLRLCLRRFEHEAFVDDLLSRTDLEPLKARLKQIDHHAAGVPTSSASSFLAEKYDELEDLIPDAFRNGLLERVRPDVRVILNGADQTPLSLRASILNRFPIHLLWRAGHLVYKQGYANRVSGSPGAYLVNFEQANGRWVLEPFAEVIVRHGPEPVIPTMVPDDLLQRLKKCWQELPDPTPTRNLWTKDHFPEVKRTAPVSDEYIARANLLTASKKLQGENVAGVRIGPIDNRVGFIVMTTTEIPAQGRIGELFDLPVRYETPTRVPRPDDDVRPPSGVLQPGALIGLRTLQEPHVTRRSGGLGTLGCFVRTGGGRIGFLTASHNLEAGPDKLMAGATIIQSDSIEMSQTRAVGTVRRFVSVQGSPPASSPSQGVVYNTMDVAIADLDAAVEYLPDFPKHYGLPPLGGIATPSHGDEVFKVGGRTGLTRGRIVSVDSVVVLSQYGTEFWMRSVIVIEGMGGRRFGFDGDSGSILARVEGDRALAVGMLIGSDRTQYHLAFAIAPALEAMECEILPAPPTS
jgi:hypothetical protein